MPENLIFKIISLQNDIHNFTFPLFFLNWNLCHRIMQFNIEFTC